MRNEGKNEDEAHHVKEKDNDPLKSAAAVPCEVGLYTSQPQARQ